jgi:hypothetical protein
MPPPDLPYPLPAPRSAAHHPATAFAAPWLHPMAPASKRRGRKNHRHRFGMDRLDDGIWRGGLKTIDKMRTGNRFGFGAAVAPVFGPDAGKREQRRSSLSANQTTSFLSSCGVCFRRIFGEAVRWRKASAFRLQPKTFRRTVYVDLTIMTIFSCLFSRLGARCLVSVYMWDAP